MDINDWLNKFKSSWENKSIDDVLSLFSTDVVYHETPFRKLMGLDEIGKEWAVIMDQNEIELNYEVYSKDNDKYTIQWDLKYINKENKQEHFKGIYLVKLNEAGLCNEFWHYCENNAF
ncbi:MAG: nuclear transport factor 2 family protein [Parcubacteria group bacterium]|jgi:hypothetical protein